MQKRNLLTWFILIILIAMVGVFFFILEKERPVFKKPRFPVLKKPVKLERVSFDKLPGWNQADTFASSLKTFQSSCKWILKRPPTSEVGNDRVSIQAKDWFEVCNDAMALKAPTSAQAKTFFEQHFLPMIWSGKKNKTGLFTGYYSPVYEGSLHREPGYTVPIYGLPKDVVMVQLRQFDPDLPARRLVGRVDGHYLKPYYTRREISEGAITDKAPVLAWLKSETDRLFLEIQGAGSVELKQGGKIYLGYAGENGAPYRSVAQVLINKGVMTKHNASMQAIRRYVKAHPKEGREAFNENPSFVFFTLLGKDYTPGTQGLALTSGYSMAVDASWVPLNVPLWLKTKRPDAADAKHEIEFERLMIAQDTGGAIKGPVRGDVYWGAGDEAAKIAGHMKHPGEYWLLMPKKWVLSH